MDIKIEKNVPIPTSNDSRRHAVTRALSALDAGDSFLVPPGESQSSVGGRSVQFAKRYGGKFITRKTPKGIRVWRIE